MEVVAGSGTEKNGRAVDPRVPPGFAIRFPLPQSETVKVRLCLLAGFLSPLIAAHTAMPQRRSFFGRVASMRSGGHR